MFRDSIPLRLSQGLELQARHVPNPPKHLGAGALSVGASIDHGHNKDKVGTGEEAKN